MNDDQPSISQLTRWARSRRTWKRDGAEVEAAVDKMQRLALLGREHGFAHFLGGALSVLESEGRISRKDFVRLMNAAHEFGEKCQ